MGISRNEHLATKRNEFVNRNGCFAEEKSTNLEVYSQKEDPSIETENDIANNKWSLNWLNHQNCVIDQEEVELILFFSFVYLSGVATCDVTKYYHV